MYSFSDPMDHTFIEHFDVMETTEACPCTWMMALGIAGQLDRAACRRDASICGRPHLLRRFSVGCTRWAAVTLLMLDYRRGEVVAALALQQQELQHQWQRPERGAWSAWTCSVYASLLASPIPAPAVDSTPNLQYVGNTMEEAEERAYCRGKVCGRHSSKCTSRDGKQPGEGMSG